jgi:pyridoxine 5-phosphate synthase
LLIAAGHGLTYRNVGAVAAIPEVAEFNIGHHIISRSVFVGLERAVREIREAIQAGRNN